MPSRTTGPANSSGKPGPVRPPAVEALQIRVATGGLLVGVRTSPAAARAAIQGIYGDRLKVSVTAPPENNRANRQLQELLAAELDLPRAHVSIDGGNASRDKVVAFRGITEADLRKRLEGILGGADPAR